MAGNPLADCPVACPASRRSSGYIPGKGCQGFLQGWKIAILFLDIVEKFFACHGLPSVPIWDTVPHINGRINMKTSMEEWDKCIAPHLRAIDYYGTRIQQEVRTLLHRPSWQTKAEVAVSNAKLALEKALAKLEEAERAFHGLEIEER